MRPAGEILMRYKIRVVFLHKLLHFTAQHHQVALP